MPRIAHGFLVDSAREFFLGHVNIVGPADLGQNQAEADTTFRDAAVFVLELVFRLALVFLFKVIVLHRVGHFAPDIGELSLNHLRRQIKAMLAIQLVEQDAFDLHARLLGVLAFDILFEHVLEAVQILETEALGQLVINLRLFRRFDVFDGDIKDSSFAGEMLGLILLREGNVQLTLLATLGTHQLFFKTRDEGAVADSDPAVFCGTTFKGLAVDLADKVDDDNVAIFSLGVLAAFLGGIGAVLVGQLAQGLIDLCISDFSDRTFDLQLGRISRFEFRHDFQADLEGEVSATGHSLGIRLDVDLRLGRRSDLALVQRFLGGLRDQLIEQIAHDGFAEHLADMLGRHFARAEAFQANFRTDFFDFRIQASLQIISRENDFIRAAQAF